MQVVHLRYIDFDWSCHDSWELEVLLLRYLEITWYFGRGVWRFGVQCALELDDWDRCVFDKLHL